MRSFLAFCLLVLGFASASAVEPPVFCTAEKDGNEVIWAFSRDEINTAFILDNTRWKAMPIPFPSGERARPVKAVRIADGAVVCVWNLNGNRMGFTWHRGKESRILGFCLTNCPEKLALFADSQNCLWVTGNRAGLHRFDIKNGSVFDYTLRSQDYLKVDKNWNTVEAVEDGRGRIWAWTNTTSAGTDCTSVRGVLLFDGKYIDEVERKDIAGIRGKWITFLGRKDETHMWLGMFEEGLYEVDIDTLQAQQVFDSNRMPFRHVDKIFNVGKDMFVVDYRHSQTELWRLRDAKWERLVQDLGGCRPSERSWLPVKDGFLLASNPYPWFIGDNQPPVRLDWSYGFTAEEARNFLLFPDGSLFAVIGNGASNFRKKIALPPKLEPSSRISEWMNPSKGQSTATPDGSLWSLNRGERRDNKWMLSQWNGERWVDHEIPPELPVQRAQSLVTDTKGRIWFLPNDREEIAAYFDTRTNAWQNFPTLEAAFESLRKDPPQFIGGRRGSCVPYYSADRKRIAFRDRDWRVAYFNGETWVRWKRVQIAPTVGAENDSPCFDAEDKLCVNIGNTTWQFDERQWRQTLFDRRLGDEYRGLGQPKLDPPDGCVTSSPESMEIDNQGTYWLTWEKRLYKCRDGSCVKVFSDTEPNPFAAGRGVMAVWVDSKGNAFVATHARSFAPTWFQIAPKSPPPKTSLVVSQTGEDGIQVRFNTQAQGKVRFRWQLDDEPWQGTTDQRIALDSLPSGEHLFKAQAVDEDLQSDPVPVEAKFKINVDPAKQLKTLIARLSDPNFTKRKAAIKALARQPNVALPALKAARLEAEADLRWWIDAAIQEIARTHSSILK